MQRLQDGAIRRNKNYQKSDNCRLRKLSSRSKDPRDNQISADDLVKQSD